MGRRDTLTCPTVAIRAVGLLWGGQHKGQDMAKTMMEKFITHMCKHNSETKEDLIGRSQQGGWSGTCVIDAFVAFWTKHNGNVLSADFDGEYECSWSEFDQLVATIGRTIEEACGAHLSVDEEEEDEI